MLQTTCAARARGLAKEKLIEDARGPLLARCSRIISYRAKRAGSAVAPGPISLHPIQLRSHVPCIAAFIWKELLSKDGMSCRHSRCAGRPLQRWGTHVV